MTIPAPAWMLSIAGFHGRRARVLAEQSRAEDRRRRDADLTQDERRFQMSIDQISADAHVVIGTGKSGLPYQISLNDFTSLPSWITAATGAGKSRLIGGLMAQLVAHILRGEPVSLVAIDGKGETADQLRRTLAQTMERLAPGEQEKFASRIHNFEFFSKKFLPSWPVLSAARGVDLLAQADVVAEVLSENADSSIGPRQRLMLSRLIALSLEQRIPIASLPWLMSNPLEVASRALQSAMPSVRLDLSRFDREPQASIDGLMSRLGVLLAVPSLKAILSGDRDFDFGACLTPGSISLFDFGGADMGARAGVRSAGSLAIAALINAAFDPRHVVRGTTLVAIDEPQIFITSTSLNQLERAVTLGRSFGVGGILLTHQGAGQLEPSLQTILNTNIPLRILGRSSERDTEAASEWLPRTGRVPRPREPGARRDDGRFMSEGQELRYRINEIGHLPSRHFLVADRRVDFAPRIVEAREYNPPPWSRFSRRIAELVQKGSCGIRRAELETRVRAIEEEADARLQEYRQSEPLQGRRRSRSIETPDIVGRSKGRGGSS